jgi:hypothetical protein
MKLTTIGTISVLEFKKKLGISPKMQMENIFVMGDTVEITFADTKSANKTARKSTPKKAVPKKAADGKPKRAYTKKIKTDQKK